MYCQVELIFEKGILKFNTEQKIREPPSLHKPWENKFSEKKKIAYNLNLRCL